MIDSEIARYYEIKQPLTRDIDEANHTVVSPVHFPEFKSKVCLWCKRLDVVTLSLVHLIHLTVLSVIYCHISKSKLMDIQC